MQLFLMAILTMFSATALAGEPDAFFNPVTAYELLQQDQAIILDVREEHEIIDGMAEGAVWLPTSKIEAGVPVFEEFVTSLDENKTLIVYCGSGKRAARIVAKLATMGIAAENMGGFSRWVDAGLPVVIPDL